MLRRPEQFESPSCATVGGDFWFPDSILEGGSPADAAFAKSICNRCPHLKECAEWGIYKEAHGIWGGLTNRDRQLVRSRRGIKIYQEDQSA
jgi:hypothetical protein